MEIHKDDYGTIFRATILDENDAVVDVGDFTTRSFIFKKPDKSIINKTASLYTDGSDGIIQYTVESGVLDTVGVWQIQAHVIGDTTSWKTDVQEFRVYKNLESC